MKKIALGISAMALALAGAAIAAEAPAHGPDHDKVLTRAEAQARAEEAFAKLDVNHDGKLDKADRIARISEHFDKIDTNHDGSISRDEFIAAHEAMHPGERPEGGRPDLPPPPPGAGPQGHEGPEGHAPHHGPDGKRPHPFEGAPLVFEILHLADPAHTDTITKDAFVAASLKLFDQADTNHDGKVTPEERRAAFAKQHHAWGKRGPGEHHGGPDHDGPPLGEHGAGD